MDGNITVSKFRPLIRKLSIIRKVYTRKSSTGYFPNKKTDGVQNRATLLHQYLMLIDKKLRAEQIGLI